MAVIDPMPTLPDEADPSTWAARWRALLNWMASLGDALNLVSPFIDAYPALQAQTNFIGNWDDQTGAKAVPTAVYHDGEFWILLENTSNIASDEPGVSAKWVAFPAPTKDLSLRVFSSALRYFDFALPAEFRRFVAQVEGVTHDGTVERALGVSFSDDDGATFTAPVVVSELVAPGGLLDDDIEFFNSPHSARSLTSNLGRRGMIVPAAATTLRLVSCKAGKSLDRLAPVGATGRILLTGFRGV